MMKRKAKQKSSTLPKMLLFLMDGEEHLVGECFDWISDGIPPSTATRSYTRFGQSRGRTEKALEDPEYAVRKGKEEEVRKTIWYASEEGYVDVFSTPGGNILNSLIRLTEEGRKYIINGRCIWGKMLRQLEHGFRTGRIKLKVLLNGGIHE